MTPPPHLDWPGPPRRRVAWWRVRAAARHPAAWVAAAAAALLIAGLVWTVLQARPGCAWHYTHDGRPVVTCQRHPP